MAAQSPAARLRAAVGAKPGEGTVLVWAAAYYFLVLAAYYVLRPIRDNMGAAGGVDNLAWLFTGTMVAMLAVHPLYTALVSRFPRRTFISLTYRFFISNLVLFFFIFRMVNAEQSVWVGRVFFIWTSVFNLFVVSVFWSLVTDVFKPGQGKRLFGIIAVGGTLGAVLGSSITTGLVGIFGPINLMLVSALILELAVQASKTLDSAERKLEVAEAGAAERASEAEVVLAEPVIATGIEKTTNSRTTIGGGVLDGIRHIIASPYLLGIASLILFYTISSTFLYFQQVDIVARVFKDDPGWANEGLWCARCCSECAHTHRAAVSHRSRNEVVWSWIRTRVPAGGDDDWLRRHDDRAGAGCACGFSGCQACWKFCHSTAWARGSVHGAAAH